MPQQPSPPNWGSPALEKNTDGEAAFSRDWYRWFNSFATPGQDPQPVTVGASPFSFEAPFPGVVLVAGGTVSAIAIIRAGTSVPTGVIAGAIPVARGDEVVITYTVLPTVNYLGN